MEEDSAIPQGNGEPTSNMLRRRAGVSIYAEEGEPEINPNPLRCVVCNNPMLVPNRETFSATGKKAFCSDRCLKIDRGNAAVKSMMTKFGKQKKNEVIIFAALYFLVALFILFCVLYLRNKD